MALDTTIHQHKIGGEDARLTMITNASKFFVNSEATKLRPKGFVAATKFANQLLGVQPTRMCLMRAASGPGVPGFRRIVNWEPTESGEYVRADGVHVREPGTMTVFQTADCLAAAFYHTVSRESVIVHCGRPAGEPDDGQNIVTDALDRIAPQGDVEHLEVVGVGSICGTHFPNEDGLARKQALSYLDEYGPEVFSDVATLSLDMRTFFTHVCVAAGLAQKQISFIGPDCTYFAPCCASHRQHLNENRPRKHAQSIIFTTH